MNRAIGHSLAAITIALLLTRLSAPLVAADAAAPVASAPYRLDKGGVVVTFDDRNFEGWIKAIPLFDKYGVKATFFISGAIDRQTLETIGQLQSHGHAIGAHSIKHLGAVEYCQDQSTEDYVRNEILPQVEALKAAGITPTAFAYPGSRNNAATDMALLKIFRHLRTGSGVAPGQQISGKGAFFVPADKIGEHGCLCGKGIDYAPTKEDRTYEQLDGALARAAKNHEIIVFYAHGLSPSGKGHHVTPEALEHIFQKAQELQLMFYTFDQLP
jgi:peptidoglycan/xylan/chitin deacetylase (PgdA/CDA1 family)